MDKIREIIIKALATGFGTGYSPFAPGTAGTILAFLLFPFLTFNHLLDSASIPFLLITAGSFFIGVWVSTKAEIYYGHDGSQIVIDEIVGYMISIAWLPHLNWSIALIAFFLFRIFDIFKPEPADKAQELPKGWGIMTDDLVAGIYCNILLQIGIRVLQ
ncbi:MAG: hypothetical protein B6244_03820 [Candidatus Cloacimonetes bacterium 4572_55]|nr:MAG: hypothetical protein B6244_03820 [Candidatus Cloacimonetes bacterium 4572_55]